MYKLIRIWSLAVLGMLGTYLVLGLLVSALTWSNFLNTIGLWLGVTGLFMGFIHLSPEKMADCFAGDDLSGTACSEITASANEQLQSTAAVTLFYVVLVLAVAAVAFVASTRLERAKINALVISKLRRADDTYIENVLRISTFDRATMGQSADGALYTADVLAREASGGHGDAQYTTASDAGLERSASKFSGRVTLYERWKPLYDKYARPSFVGSLLLTVRLWLVIFLIAATWFSLFSSELAFIPLLFALAAVAVIYLPNKRWRDTYVQFAGNDTNLLLAVILTVVFCTVTYLTLLLGGFAFGSKVFAFAWIPFLNVYAFTAAIIVVALPLSNFFVYRHRANADADRTISQFFRTLLDGGVKGTHAFATCDSCLTPTILILGQAHDCESCGRPVDASMKVSTVIV